MADSNSEDRLPPGWTVEVKVRKNGKKDKVVIEKGVAEGLPEGWIKKTRVTKKSSTVRRDSYYIDPVSGYVFQSIKDAVRYLESGEIGRNAFKPKDKGGRDIELKDDIFSSAGVARKPKLSVGRVTRRTVMSQGTNLDRIVNDQQTPKTACTGEPMPLSEHSSCQCAMGIELTGLVPSQAECSDEKEGKVSFAESNSIPSCADGVVPEKQLPESLQTKHATEKVQKGQVKSKRKKEINLPRRASKRLAGIQVDPVPELITRRRNAAKNSGEVALTNEDKSSGSFSNEETKQLIARESASESKRKPQSLMNTMESPKLNQSKHSYGSLCAPEKLPEKTFEEPKSEKDQECYSFLSPGNTVTVNEQVKDLEGGAKFDYSLDLPLGELLSDPCIAFAIQTLTEGTFETSKNTQISSEVSDSKYSETSASAKGDDSKIKGQNVSDWKQECSASSPPKDLVAEHAGSTSESPFGISWMDPCIEFAVKTLTGNIPVEYDPNSENCLQQQLGTSNNQGLGEVAFSGGSLNNLRQTDYYCSQYLGTQDPVFKQQSFLDTALPNARSVGMGNSTGARLHQYGGEDRRNGRQR
ncbi:methyl-CpG-binding domain-containing protein 13 isoform X2 [Neltuma alba]|uniref:methyl-CpG-binding domain-containing protein 13 isoform X2 n=1 Tax=Neltuma alba TaxID=207710 RepID=UPI0010A3A6C5|nr:methyl-CpG-binding domain-containing protein 13-like isoform X2 [Prosopis alba]